MENDNFSEYPSSATYTNHVTSEELHTCSLASVSSSEDHAAFIL